jgi:CO dehydrogenase maturation factor
MKIAISGKGGSGKTTLAGTLARLFSQHGYEVLAIDGDSNPNLAIALGMSPEQAEQVGALPGNLLHEVVSASGEKSRELAVPLEEVVERYGVQAADSVRLLSMKKIDHAGAG